MEEEYQAFRNATVKVEEPSHREVFYTTSNSHYGGVWHNGLPATKIGDVPPISVVLGGRPLVKRPVRPIMTTAKCILAKQMDAERKSRQADRVLSADIVPKVFPVRSDQLQYPGPSQRGSDNPLYATSAMAYGSAPPAEHQITDRFFPATNEFSKCFVDLKPRYTGLNTAPTHSKVHKAFDEYY
mmetsp:Transcript_37533/g.82319  ORF Transcript_37533/g.82319 Transcript_37533/m.82319 type:complete len:184 (+) Transcript_37533:96-647(+)